jgi:hypothetical protein
LKQLALWTGLVSAACGLILAGPGCGSGVDRETQRTFEEAQAAFDRATSSDDFLKVAAMYRQVLDSGIVSGAVLYNQGNAYMRAGYRGRAIAAYREAKRYRPSDPDLEANLNYALVSDDRTGRKPVVEYLLFWQDWVGYPAKFRAVGILAALALVLAVAALYVRRRPLGILTLGLLGLTLVAGVSAGYDWYRFDHTVHGVVTEPEVVARKGNSTSYEPAFTEPLKEGTEFTLQSRRGDWLLVRIAPNQEGWLPETSAVLY